MHKFTVWTSVALITGMLFKDVVKNLRLKGREAAHFSSPLIVLDRLGLCNNDELTIPDHSSGQN